MDRFTRRRTTLQWRQEQLRATQTTLNEFRSVNTAFDRPTAINNANTWNAMRVNVTQLNNVGAASGITVTATGYAVPENFTVEVIQRATAHFVVGSQQDRDEIPDMMSSTLASLGMTGGANLNINGTAITIGENRTLAQAISQINASEAGVTVRFDNLRGAFTMTSNTTGQDSNIVIGSGSNAFFEELGLMTAGTLSTTDGSRAGQDAFLRLTDSNGAINGGADLLAGSNTYTGLFRSSSNVIRDIGGLIIDISNATDRTVDGSGNTVTAGQSININVHRNMDDAMDAIREFVENYNNLIRYLNLLHTTPRPRAGNSVRGAFFEPLTDEERAAMSDREIERWEEQARIGLLHRDRDIRNLHDQIRQAMFAPVTLADGTQFSLFNIGITTVGRNGAPGDQLIGVLQIDEERLREELEANPERVQQLFARTPAEVNGGMLGATIEQRNARAPYVGLGFRLDDLLRTAADDDRGSLRQRAGYTRGLNTTENIMSRQIRDYDRRIEQMQAWLVRRENHFFAMFARMEAAMAQSHAQMDSLFAFGMQ
jgi:flagellar hook-associated protein 2